MFLTKLFVQEPDYPPPGMWKINPLPKALRSHVRFFVSSMCIIHICLLSGCDPRAAEGGVAAAQTGTILVMR